MIFFVVIGKSDYSFPSDENTGRRFQYECLTRFPWLAYSAAEKVVFASIVSFLVVKARIM